MHFFSVNNLAATFKNPAQPVIAQLITAIYKYYQVLEAKGLEYPAGSRTFKQFFADYEQLLGEAAPSALQELANKLVSLREEGVINQFGDQIIFAYPEAKPVSYDLYEYHSHTYDVHIVFEQAETYIFSLLPASAGTADTAKDNIPADCLMISYMPQVKSVVLNQGEGCVITPNLVHFANFGTAESVPGSHFKKCIVKIPAELGEYCNLP